MTFDIPNLGDADYAEQARLYGADFAMLSQPSSLTGVKNGCGVTAQASPNMTLQVASGAIYWLNSEVAVIAGNVTVTAANGTNPRIDLVVVSSTGVKSVVAGAPAAIPTEPSLPASSIGLAQVIVPAGATSIGPTQIRDRRLVMQIPTVLGGTTIVRKTADETVPSSTTLQPDNHLFFTMATNTVYAVNIILMINQPLTNNAMKVSFVLPGGTVWRLEQNGTVRGSDVGAGNEFALGTGQSPLVYPIHGVLATVGTGGNFTIWWAQSNPDANGMVMLKNSYIEYRALA